MAHKIMAAEREKKMREQAGGVSTGENQLGLPACGISGKCVLFIWFPFGNINAYINAQACARMWVCVVERRISIIKPPGASAIKLTVCLFACVTTWSGIFTPRCMYVTNKQNHNNAYSPG